MEWDLREIFGLLSTALGIGGLLIYISSIRTGLTKPHCFSWLIWSLIMFIAFSAQLSDDAGAGAWVIGVSGISCFLIAIYGYFKGEKSITRSDWIAFVTALSAIPLWYFTRDALFAVILVSLIDAIAFYPTFRKSWNKPFEESLMAYAICALTYILSIAALENVTFTTALYPATLVLTNSCFVITALSRRKVLAHG